MDVRKMFSKNLRIQSSGNQASWSNDELIAGFLYYKQLHGHFPTAHQIDEFAHLPSSRSIQRARGGLVGLRSELFPDETANHTRGEVRSQRAQNINATNKTAEARFYLFLIGLFEEISVHEHKVIRPGDVSCDFYIYLTPKSGIAIDIFYADSVKNMLNIINIKLKRYELIRDETYLVIVGNESITTETVDLKLLGRKSEIPKHITIATEQVFRSVIIPKLLDRSNYTSI
jgi:hypothetical protein